MIRYCPNCKDELWRGNVPKANLYACPSCENIYKVEKITPIPSGGKKVYINGIGNTELVKWRKNDD